ncbi:TRAP transporter small permease [Parabacteroides sp. PF5-9]|uniref:TRAP transporter small permease n=1 Tax=Parabacteroides sp. PF5-9 TaxID=1742404 RepID=UPI0024758AD5|nr:TRAP transporter small permease [Parabacteroides sp. PF5-9]MDH6358602.1 TRAP-type C4-dicarboxylate transport system permease small subunit [Parabacteroides sp. PF5-9]
MRKIIDKSLESLLIFLMAFLVLDVLWQVMSRYILASPSSVTDELAGFLLIWVGLLGAAYVSGCNQHLAIDLLMQNIRPERQQKLQLFIFFIVFIFALTVLIIGGGWLVYTRFYLNVTSASLQLNMGYVYLVLPISGLLTAYYAIDNAIRLFRSSTNSTM